MPIKVITTEFGHSIPPEGKHTITMHAPSWKAMIDFRDGDMSIFQKLVSLYPRFSPWADARQLSVGIGKKLEVSEGTGVLMYTSPDTFIYHHEFRASDHRKKEYRLLESEVGFKIVDINDVRLYVVTYPSKKSKGIIGAWQNAGFGLSTRTAEYLLPHVDDLKVVDWSGDLSQLPPPTYLPENESHGRLRKRISDLMHRAPIDPTRVKVTPDDVYIYVTGMAAIYHLNKALMARHSGTVLVLGAVFHSTWHLFEESPGGLKHFGDCSASSGVLDKVEEYLEAEAKAGRKISYAFTEFPSNPILVCVDLKRLRQLADRYDFALVVDDTVGSWSNLDLSPVADLIITSTTKSFSGYANVMGGTVVLNPDAPRYNEIKPLFASAYHNEYFAGDADKMLGNSNNYLERSAILNRNGAALAALLQKEADDPSSPVTGVRYPPQNDTFEKYKALMRRPTPDFTPGYGCLLGVDFEDVESTIAYYDNLSFYCGPHLGAHHSLAMPFNAVVYGGDENFKYHVAYGVREEQIRMSVGLEEEEELLDTVKFALQKAREAKASKATSTNGKVEKKDPQVITVAAEVSANFEG